MIGSRPCLPVLRVGVLRIVVARHQGEHPENLARRLVAGEVDLAGLGGDVRVLARRRYLALHRGHAGRPGRVRPEQEHRRDGDDGQTGHTKHDLARARHSSAASATPSSVDQRLGALPGWRPAATRVRPAWPVSGPDERRQVIVLLGVLVLDDVMKCHTGLRPAWRRLLRRCLPWQCLLRLGLLRPRLLGLCLLGLCLLGLCLLGLGRQGPRPGIPGPAGRPVPAVAGVGEFPGMGLTPVEQLVLKICGSDF